MDMVHFFIKIMAEFMKVNGLKIKCMEQVILFRLIKGTLFYASGKPAYEGQWVNDKFQGKGTLYNEEPQMLFSDFDFGDFD